MLNTAQTHDNLTGVQRAPERILAKWTKAGHGAVSTPASCGLVAGVSAEYVRADIHGALAADNIRLRSALQPFADYASLSSFDLLPDNHPLTQGSRMAAKQVTAADFRAALLATQEPKT